MASKSKTKKKSTNKKSAAPKKSKLAGTPRKTIKPKTDAAPAAPPKDVPAMTRPDFLAYAQDVRSDINSLRVCLGVTQPDEPEWATAARTRVARALYAFDGLPGITQDGAPASGGLRISRTEAKGAASVFGRDVATLIAAGKIAKDRSVNDEFYDKAALQFFKAQEEIAAIFAPLPGAQVIATTEATEATGDGEDNTSGETPEPPEPEPVADSASEEPSDEPADAEEEDGDDDEDSDEEPESADEEEQQPETDEADAALIDPETAE